MTALPIKSEYGPTLGRLLSPHWRAASAPLRALALAAIALLLAGLVGLALTLQDAKYSHGGRLPFSFAYRDLYRVAPDPGGFVKVRSSFPNGTLKYSFAVAPLRMPAYAGEQTAEVPVFATGLVRTLASRYRDFAFRGEGRTRISNTSSGYAILFTARVQGERVYGRAVLLLPPGRGVREGVIATMLTAATASKQVLSPIEVGTSGVLLRPMKSLAFG